MIYYHLVALSNEWLTLMYSGEKQGMLCHLIVVLFGNLTRGKKNTVFDNKNNSVTWTNLFFFFSSKKSIVIQ
jgi:hypothetical protein